MWHFKVPQNKYKKPYIKLKKKNYIFIYIKIYIEIGKN